MNGLVFVTAKKDKFTHTVNSFTAIAPVELNDGDWCILETIYNQHKALIDANATITTDYVIRDILTSEFKIV